MARYDKLRFSPNVTHDRKKLIDEVKSMTSGLSFLYRNRNDDCAIEVRSNVGGYFFTVNNPTVAANGHGTVVFYDTHFFPKPAGTGELNRGQINGNREEVIKKFNSWRTYIYDIITLPEEDEDNLSALQSEIEEEWIEAGDDISETEFYSYEKQRMLLILLERLRLPLSQVEEAEAVEIVKNIEELETDLSKLPQKPTVKRLSRIIAKLRKWSVKRAEELYDVAKKELYKRILTGQIGDDIRGLLDNLNL